MTITLRVILLIVSVLNCGWVLRRIRKAQMKIEDSVFWILFSTVLVFMSVFPGVVAWGAKVTGIQSPVNFVFLSIIFNENLKITQKVRHRELSNLAQQYDFIIVGSDCVWNGDAFALETAYLLDFVDDNSKKGNFASSFACDFVQEEQKPTFQKYLSQFPCLSVREQRGKELIWELIGKEATVVLDPTLTRNQSFWKKITHKSKLNITEDYIFVAEYAVSPALMRDAEKLSKQFKLPIYCLYPPKGKRISVKTFFQAGPEDVLYLIEHSKFVLTDSYHMMIFAINFNREFFAYRTVTNIPAISKYTSILKCLQLEDRLFATEGVRENPLDILTKDQISWEHVNGILQKEREISLRYLEKILCCADLKMC